MRRVGENCGFECEADDFGHAPLQPHDLRLWPRPLHERSVFYMLASQQREQQVLPVSRRSFQPAVSPILARFNGQTRSKIVWNCLFEDGQDAYGDAAGPQDSFLVFGYQ